MGLAHALAYRRESEARALNSAQLETRLVEAQLQALQRQLHPHFLFNTLNTISGLMRTNVNAADLMGWDSGQWTIELVYRDGHLEKAYQKPAAIGRQREHDRGPAEAEGDAADAGERSSVGSRESDG